MTITRPYNFKPAAEIQRIAGRAASKKLPDEVGETLPFPKQTPDGIAILILYYKRTGSPGTPPKTKPPHHAMLLDGTSGTILDFSTTTPTTPGIRTPTAQEVTGPDDLDAYEVDRDRLLDIASLTWMDFATDDRASAACARAREYWRLFTRIEQPEVAPFYLEASPAFFDYLRNCETPIAPPGS